MFMRNIFLTTLIILSLAAPAMGRMMHDSRGVDYVPPPRLMAPTTEEVDLTGKTELEFKWSPHEGQRDIRKYYDFRLYKGYNILEDSLIFKEQVDPSIYQISIKSDMFEAGQVYTWSLRQIYEPSHKSDRSMASFKVIKK